jgi:hypothetical protein
MVLWLQRDFHVLRACPGMISFQLYEVIGPGLGDELLREGAGWV